MSRLSFPPHWKDMRDTTISTVSTNIPIDNSVITFKDPNTELIFEINKEGQIVIGKGYTPSEAADMFLERLSETMPNFVNSKTEHLQKENKELSRRIKELEEENQLFTQANNDLVMVAQAWRENVMQLEQNR
jgi:antitoxin component of RelBE/YafQ-DinJ toxin-antitoxin module